MLRSTIYAVHWNQLNTQINRINAADEKLNEAKKAITEALEAAEGLNLDVKVRAELINFIEDCEL